MNKAIQQLLQDREDNHVLPFFWQHGEDEQTLRRMMAAIRGANCRAVCVESRPHPDFCGEKWWRDMDVILDEAKSRGMKVWILDDSHFPTGYANGALQAGLARLCRQGIFDNRMALPAEGGPIDVDLEAAGLLSAPKKDYTNPMEEHFFNQPPARVFDDDRILSVSMRLGGRDIDLTDRLTGSCLSFDKPDGEGELRVLALSRNTGCHRNYINMTQRDSVRVLIDAVYEPHWQHYAADFGRTIAGFFSDEPELGNGYLYDKGNLLGNRQDLPWGSELEDALRGALGEGWRMQLHRLWEKDADPETARVHYLYMDALTRLVERNFSRQIGDWCREHGVMYIGHVIEDDGQHCRTGTSLGHYFRGLAGQDMAGIDDIGGQVLPQGEDEPVATPAGFPRYGTFYHYGLAKLAQSAAALESGKRGRSMCEIFGNYGWEEGLRLEKYLADHFLVRGINYYVPHAFTGKAFPDPDCPPHFYAHGHHPQYRHFGELMRYMNRVATLISSGRHRAQVAILYHAEAEWCDRDAMPFEVPLRALYDRQIDCHVLPADLLTDARASGRGLEINGQRYQAVVIPACASLCSEAVTGLDRLAADGVPVFFVDKKPGFISQTGAPLPGKLAGCPVIPLSGLAGAVRSAGVSGARILPENCRIRLLEILGDTRMLLAVNEGTEPWSGTVRLPDMEEKWFLYDAWMNRCLPAQASEKGVRLTVEPLKSVFLVSGDCDAPLYQAAAPGDEVPLTGWRRSLCEGADYPNFSRPEPTALPDGDALAAARPQFSGFVRYECAFTLPADTPLILTLEDAREGVEVFLNGKSAGIQIVPPFAYDLAGQAGENHLCVEVATTLERQCYPLLEGFARYTARLPVGGSGITGRICMKTAIVSKEEQPWAISTIR